LRCRPDKDSLPVRMIGLILVALVITLQGVPFNDVDFKTDRIVWDSTSERCSCCSFRSIESEF
jgi:hypothetical protein